MKEYTCFSAVNNGVAVEIRLYGHFSCYQTLRLTNTTLCFRWQTQHMGCTPGHVHLCWLSLCGSIDSWFWEKLFLRFVLFCNHSCSWFYLLGHLPSGANIHTWFYLLSYFSNIHAAFYALEILFLHLFFKTIIKANLLIHLNVFVP